MQSSEWRILGACLQDFLWGRRSQFLSSDQRAVHAIGMIGSGPTGSEMAEGR